MHTVYETLKELEVGDKTIITLFNKQDKITEDLVLRDFKADKTVTISAKTGSGLNQLLNTIEEILRDQKVYIEKVFPYNEAGKIQLIRKNGQLLKEEYVADGIYIEAYVPKEIYGKM